jgi:hypothetical protein
MMLLCVYSVNMTQQNTNFKCSISIIVQYQARYDSFILMPVVMREVT